MVLRPIGELIKKNEAPLLEEADVKHFIEKYCRERLKTRALYCEGVNGGWARVRVASPTIRQEVYLLEYEVRREIEKELLYQLKGLKVTQS